MSHIDKNRLREVVNSDERLFFSDEEFKHLYDCADCFNDWAEFYRQFKSPSEPDASDK